MKTKTYKRWSLLTIIILLLVLLSACSPGSAGNTPPTPTAAPVNGFGSAANHTHSLLALSSHILVLATHYGIYYSANNGTTWQQVSGGQNQLMQGLMDYALVQSPLNPQRLFVLTQPSLNPHRGTVGLYTSADQGRTWKLSIDSSTISSKYIFTEVAGNDSPDQVYIYLSEQGALGLKVSMDDGQHFTRTGTLPFGNIARILAVPGEPGHLLVASSDGMASSSDGGEHWQIVKGITGGVFEFATVGAHSPIYVSGDAGIYVSKDAGKSFALVNTQASYGSLTVSDVQTQVIYGRTGTAVYRSSNGGKTWTALPHIAGNLTNLAADPANPSQVYLSLSYPTAVYAFGQNGTAWSSLTPKI